MTSVLERVRYWWRVLKARVGFRGASLLTFAFIDFVQAYSLWDPATQPKVDMRVPVLRSYQAFLDVMPFRWWAVLWGVVGVICAVQGFARRVDVFGFTAAMFIKALWSAGFLYAWFEYDAYRAWVAASVWFVFGAFVLLISAWKEPSKSRRG